jgi:hypothetical protein
MFEITTTDIFLLALLKHALHVKLLVQKHRTPTLDISHCVSVFTILTLKPKWPHFTNFGLDAQ